MATSNSIFILSSPRSGSTWLTYLLSRYPNTDNFGEIFNQDLNNEIKYIPKSPQDYFKYVLEKIIKSNKQNKNILFSTFLEHSLGLDLIINLVQVVNVIIFNYRTNVFHQWISQRKAQTIREWRNVDLTNVKIDWSEELFLDFRNRAEIVHKLAELLQQKGFNIGILNYEEIHSFQNTKDKIEFINEKLSKIKIKIDDFAEIDLKKQNLNYDYEKCFNNYDEFKLYKNTDLFYLNKLN